MVVISDENKDLTVVLGADYRLHWVHLAFRQGLKIWAVGRRSMSTNIVDAKEMVQVNLDSARLLSDMELVCFFWGEDFLSVSSSEELVGGDEAFLEVGMQR